MKRGAVQWTIIELALRQGLGLGVSIFLARMLGPASFGLVALTSFFASLGIAVLQTSLIAIVIQRQGCTPDQRSSLFWLILIASGAAAALIVQVAVPVARFYDQPILAELMPLAALQVLLTAFSTMPTAILTYDLNIRPLALAGIAAFLASGATAIITALAGWGVWALALQPVLFAFVNSVLVWCATDWRPRTHLSLSEVLPLVRSASMISASSALEVAYSQGFALIIGKYGVFPLGLYNRAQGIQQIPGNLIATCINRLALPIMAQASESRPRLREICTSLIKISVAVSFPTMAILAALAPRIVLVLFGPTWSGAAPLLVYLALAGALFPMHVINLQIPIVLNRTHRYFQAEVAKKVVGFSCLIVGSFMGIVGLAISQSVFSAVAFFINAYLAKRMLGYGALAQLRDVAPIAFATALLVCFVQLLEHLLVMRTAISPAPLLAFLLIAGGLFYVALIVLLYPDVRREALKQFKPLLVRGEP
jgi:teichuronic acid exporter